MTTPVVCGNMRFRGDSSCPVHERTRTPLLRSSRCHNLCRFMSWERKELDEGPHTHFLSAGRKSLGSCQLGDTMETRPKQLRYNLWLRTLALKQLKELGKRESQLDRSIRVIEGHAETERKHDFIECG